jgi:hypothetical protein
MGKIVAVLALAVATLLTSLPSTASADAGQLCRAGANIVLAPLDLAAGPFIAGKDEYYGLTEIDDPLPLKIAGAVPGYILLVALQGGGTVFREMAGVMELVPGMVTLFREGEQPPLFRSQQEAWALYSEDFGPCPVHIGTSYNTINDG